MSQHTSHVKLPGVSTHQNLHTVVRSFCIYIYNIHVYIFIYIYIYMYLSSSVCWHYLLPWVRNRHIHRISKKKSPPLIQWEPHPLLPWSQTAFSSCYQDPQGTGCVMGFMMDLCIMFFFNLRCSICKIHQKVLFHMLTAQSCSGEAAGVLEDD